MSLKHLETIDTNVSAIYELLSKGELKVTVQNYGLIGGITGGGTPFGL